MTARSQRATQLSLTPWWLSLPEPVRDILSEVCWRRNVSLSELQSGTKTVRLIVAREDLWRIMRAKGYSFPQCGRAVQMHHTTVMAAMKRDPKRYDKQQEKADADQG